MPTPQFPEVENAITRRDFFNWAVVGWAGFTAAMGAFLAASGRLFFPNITFEPPQQFKAGFPAEYAANKVDERFKKRYGVWLVRNERGIYCLSTVCTHLGCTPNWLEGESKFKCPCHGSGFYSTGINFEGPAPRPLERYKIGRGEDGQITVDKNMKYQFEKGQWNDANSFLELA